MGDHFCTEVIIMNGVEYDRATIEDIERLNNYITVLLS